jgi:hypothetical protein
VIADRIVHPIFVPDQGRFLHSWVGSFLPCHLSQPADSDQARIRGLEDSVCVAFAVSSGECGNLKMFDWREFKHNGETVAKTFGVACLECPCALGCWKTVWIPVAIKCVAWIACPDRFYFVDVCKHCSV